MIGRNDEDRVVPLPICLEALDQTSDLIVVVGHRLVVQGPGGFELRNVGLVRWGRKSALFMKRYQCQVLEWEEFQNYAGRPCRVPRRWAGTQLGDAGEFSYEAVRASEPRAVFGEGFLYGFDYQGRFAGLGAASGRVEGRGYVEQLGRFLR